MKLASRIAKLEGKKHEASIGDVREILKIIRNLIQEDANYLHDILPKDSCPVCLFEESHKKLKKKLKKKSKKR